jgi:hypothetical protein
MVVFIIALLEINHLLVRQLVLPKLKLACEKGTGCVLSL